MTMSNRMCDMNNNCLPSFRKWLPLLFCYYWEFLALFVSSPAISFNCPPAKRANHFQCLCISTKLFNCRVFIHSSSLPLAPEKFSRGSWLMCSDKKNLTPSSWNIAFTSSIKDLTVNIETYQLQKHTIMLKEQNLSSWFHALFHRLLFYTLFNVTSHHDLSLPLSSSHYQYT